MDWSAHAKALADTLVVPLNYSKKYFPELPKYFPELPRNDKINRTNLPFSQSSLNRNAASDQTKNSSYQRSNNVRGPTPFVKLDDYVTNVLGNRGGIQGSIRTWSMDFHFRKEAVEKSSVIVPVGTITYQIKNNRYCEHVGRAHKSNGIMWTVDLAALQCWQSCYDPDCRLARFRGARVNLPDDVKADVKDVLFDMEIAQLDEEEAIREAHASKNSSIDGDQVNSLAKDEFSPFGSEEEDAAFEKALLALDLPKV